GTVTMEYERIHKVQVAMGVMSPTKLRMKLLGMGSHPHGAANKDEAASKSPSRLHADDHPKNSLLPPQELDEGSSEYPKDRSDSSSRSRSSGSHGRSAAHSGNGGSFEFHMEERAAVAGLGPFFRQVPSKWNDAEKWIAGRHVVHSNPIFSKKAAAAHGHSGVGGGCVRVAPESAPPPPDAKKVSGGSALTELPRSPSPSSSLSSVTGPASKQRRDTKLRTQVSAPAAAQSSSVSMRDVGTEMTPIASQEQSRSGTPAGAATPSLSPLCSVPASPSASERELQIRTRREIAALGLQLGKMSIASWASKEDRIRTSPEKSAGEEDEAKKEEFEARAAAWAESKKCKFASRYQRKEVKIQEWENCQKSKFEAKMRHAEVQADQMKARAKNSLTKRLSTLSHKVEGKQARVEARRNRRAVRLARQVERIRKTGRVPSRFRCCSWFLC
uniref:Remorin C-terminal domain-containing protein n=2 Tax=Aegilops tauschii subsp. strangulata TaxID=200361 RepID=A0A453JMH6_AEGTS